ncbi:hypothetical protein MPSEU_001088400 [Mayamaea pseudoterrestris]|nr:hypothetical protein MPSEU_001088400 [Mayamaea pseudoterrestris]
MVTSLHLQLICFMILTIASCSDHIRQDTPAFFETESSIHQAETCTVASTSPPTINDIDLGVEQEMEEEAIKEVAEVIRQANDYMYRHISSNQFTPQVVRDCKLKDSLCAYWATQDECSSNPIYMHEHCGPVCQTCDWHDLSKRCPVDVSENALRKAGDLNALFKRIANDEYIVQKYKLQVLSRPHDDDLAGYQAQSDDGPWILQFDNILSNADCQQFIQLGMQEGFQLSEEILEDRLDGTFTTGPVKERTSTNAWCTSQACMNHDAARNLEHFVANLTGIPSDNMEHFQIIQYLPGQSYNSHNDYKLFMNARPSGQRILTFLIYLNNVDGGGETRFPALHNITVVPKAGRAILWPSVLDANPARKDERTLHAALEVTEGFKYAINTWIHMRDFKTSWRIGC